MLCSIGGLEVRSLRYLPRFAYLTYRTRRDALRSEGLISLALFNRGRTQFVLSHWESPVHLKTYARRGIHGRIMTDETKMFRFFHNLTLQTDHPIAKADAIALWEERFGK